jgi:hypothetical protein
MRLVDARNAPPSPAFPRPTTAPLRCGDQRRQTLGWGSRVRWRTSAGGSSSNRGGGNNGGSSRVSSDGRSSSGGRGRGRNLNLCLWHVCTGTVEALAQGLRDQKRLLLLNSCIVCLKDHQGGQLYDVRVPWVLIVLRGQHVFHRVGLPDVARLACGPAQQFHVSLIRRYGREFLGDPVDLLLRSRSGLPHAVRRDVFPGAILDESVRGVTRDAVFKD